MPYKINISENGKTVQIETDADLSGKKIGEKIKGEDLKSELKGYELEVTGTSDSAGFPGKKDIPGPNLRRVILTKGWGLKKMPKRDGKNREMAGGIRRKKTVRGNEISEKTVQINTKVLKKGEKDLESLKGEGGEKGGGSQDKGEGGEKGGGSQDKGEGGEKNKDKEKKEEKESKEGKDEEESKKEEESKE